MPNRNNRKVASCLSDITFSYQLYTFSKVGKYFLCFLGLHIKTRKIVHKALYCLNEAPLPPPITQTLFLFAIWLPLMAFFLCRSPKPVIHLREPVGLFFRTNSAVPIVNSPALYLVQLKLVKVLWSPPPSEKPKWQPHATPEWNIFLCELVRSFSHKRHFITWNQDVWSSGLKRLEVQLLKLTGKHFSDIELCG